MRRLLIMADKINPLKIYLDNYDKNDQNLRFSYGLEVSVPDKKKRPPFKGVR